MSAESIRIYILSVYSDEYPWGLEVRSFIETLPAESQPMDYRYGNTSTSKWPWGRSLALARSGQTVQVHEILFGAVKDHCWELGIRQGSVLTLGDHDDDGVDVTLPTGDLTRVPRHYAWFVAVDPL